MIEIEKKFILKKGEKERLLKDAVFVTKKIMTDVYYDTRDYSLAKKDWWLRSRNKNFELKISLKILTGDEKPQASQYRELESKKEIKKALGIFSDMPLKNSLGHAGYAPIMTLVTAREKYRKDVFSIDIDSVDFGFEIAEIELMVPDRLHTDGAERQILAFAKKHGLSFCAIRGKVLEYLKRYKPGVFDALIREWRALKT